MPKHAPRPETTTSSFNASSIAAVCSSFFSYPGLSLSEKRAAARAILRHNIHIDASPRAIPNGELDPRYRDIHGIGDARGIELGEINAVTSEVFRDVLDATSTLDIVDGGISLVLHCPGYDTTTTILPENITVDIYVSPRELVEGGEKFSESVALMVQDFGTNLAIPHLRRFQNRCITGKVKPPIAQVPGKQISVMGPSYLPRESTGGSGHIRCRCRPDSRGALAQAIATHKLPSANLTLPLSTLPTSQTETKGKGVDNKYLANDKHAAHLSGMNDHLDDTIISLGPLTDAVLGHFKLSGALIPGFRVLTQTVQSSRWEGILRSEWGLTFQQAVSISRALQSDLGVRALEVELRSASRKLWVLAISVFLVVFAFFYLV